MRDQPEGAVHCTVHTDFTRQNRTVHCTVHTDFTRQNRTVDCTVLTDFTRQNRTVHCTLHRFYQAKQNCTQNEPVPYMEILVKS